MMATLRAPFPWFGGKSRATHLVWQALGDVGGYCEPFAGSLACLLARPTPPGVETVNDLDGYLVNFWRAVQAAPEEVAKHADWPVTEIDLTARHHWLVTTGRERVERMSADASYYDSQVAGWWVWGLCCWIGSGWCDGSGPWSAGEDGRLYKIPHLSNAGRGINRQIPDLSNNAGRGLLSPGAAIAAWLGALSIRLRCVRITCGSWDRILGPSVTRSGGGVCGVLLDPPYIQGADIYAQDGSGVFEEVCRWAEEHGDDPRLRIVLCGHEGDWVPPSSRWQTVAWKRKGGVYGSADRGDRERLWCSPACLPVGSQQTIDLSGAGAR